MKRELKLVRRNRVGPVFSFSENQREVIAHRGSPLIVYGGPGTGKTRTLIENVLSRTENGVDPNSILILTYGRESASKLRDAIALRAGATSFEPLARTFHALAFSILNEKLRDDDLRYVLISGAEQDFIIGQMLSSPFDSTKWDDSLKRARGTRGFIREVRDLILRATELGLTPETLAKAGKSLGEKYWESAAQFWESYLRTTSLSSRTVGEAVIKIDPSAIIIEAIKLLESDPLRLAFFRKRYTTILVDEFQESDPSHRKLLALLASPELVIFADPDSAVGRFRGADPDGLLRACALFSDQQITLDQNFRSSFAINALGVEIAERFRSTSPTRKRSSQIPDLKRTQPIECAKLSSSTQSAEYAAFAVRSAHLHDGLAWSQMAVLLRNPGSDLQALVRAFIRNGIPITVDASATPLADNPAIRPLLLAAEIALKIVEKGKRLSTSDWPLIEELLLSEFGGGDALALRRIRVSLTKIRSDHRSTTEMMIDTLVSGVSDLPWEECAPLKNIYDLLTRARKSINKTSSISDLLWAIWESSKNHEGVTIPYLWQERALNGGTKGAQADRELDSIIQLFEAARRFTERNHGASPQLFIDQLRGERILSDSITTSAAREEVVSILTVHASKGLEFEFVVIAGLQEGSWPNLKERGTLLGSERLVESHRSALTAPAQIKAAAAAGLMEDERRLLHVAITRAKSRLLAISYEGEDAIASRYFDEIYESIHGDDSSHLIRSGARSLTSQALVATLRRGVENGSALSASLLAALKSSGIKSADPSTWLGALPFSTQLPVIDPELPVRVSPSSLGSFDECALKWFLEKSGAQDADSSAQLLGVAIHYIASQIHTKPGFTLDDAISELEKAWPVVDQNIGWFKQDQLKVARRMLTRLFEWHEENPRELVFVEEKFDVEIGRALLSGFVDRMEIDPTTGKYFVVDIKTGEAMSGQEARENKQLFAYQLGVVGNGFKSIPEGAQSAGAGLLYVGKKTDKNETMNQPPVDVENFKEAVAQVAEEMAASTFKATVNKNCERCKVRFLCPLQSYGRSVLDE